MRLGKLIELLQNSLRGNDKITYRVGINTEDKDECSLTIDTDYRYHIYIAFDNKVLSEIAVYNIDSIYKDSYSSRLYKQYEKGLWRVGNATGLLREATTLKITEVNSIEQDLENTFQQISNEFNKRNNRRKLVDKNIDNIDIDIDIDWSNLNIVEPFEN